MTTSRSDAPAHPWGLRRERGTSLIDYVLIGALIVAVCLIAVTFFGHAATTKADPARGDRPTERIQVHELLPLTPA